MKVEEAVKIYCFKDFAVDKKNQFLLMNQKHVSLSLFIKIIQGYLMISRSCVYVFYTVFHLPSKYLISIALCCCVMSMSKLKLNSLKCGYVTQPEGSM